MIFRPAARLPRPLSVALALAAVLAAAPLQAQVTDPKDSVREKATERTNNAVERGIDRTLDRAEQGLKKLFRRRDKNDKPAEPAPAAAATATVGATTATAAAGAAGGAGSTGLKAYTKFDFVPGEQVIAFEDFLQDAVGDFPARWNTNAGGEVVRLEGQPSPWLKLPERGLVYPEFVQALPENFTVEFDMAVSDDLSNNMSGLRVHFPLLAQRTLQFDANFGSEPQVGFDLHPVPEGDGSISHAWVFGTGQQKLLENSVPLAWKRGAPNRVSIWRQKTRVRLYVNETKVWDLPRAFEAGQRYSMLMSADLFGGAVFLSNLRVAVGAPDTRHKLLSEGRLVTRGILFDVNADRIKPESYAVLKEIGTVLAENPSLQLLIVGHTDSDGDDARNLELSKRRAEAVKAALAGEFGIAPARLATDGKGEGQPAEPNTTPQGKANNRRVEFIRR